MHLDQLLVLQGLLFLTALRAGGVVELPHAQGCHQGTSMSSASRPQRSAVHAHPHQPRPRSRHPGLGDPVTFATGSRQGRDRRPRPDARPRRSRVVLGSLAMGEVVRVRLDLAYDGTDFSGWAAQPGRRTVEGELSAALSTVLRSPAPVRLRSPAGRCGRSRARPGRPRRRRRGGVETGPGALRPLARGGVADPLRRRAPLRHDRREGGARAAGFDARFSATSRRYLYRLADDLSVHDPLADVTRCPSAATWTRTR